MLENNEIKTQFRLRFREILEENISLKHLLYDVFTHGTAYVVGGFLRDILTNKPYRDIDIIVDLEHDLLINIINESNIIFEMNRHNGIKMKFKNMTIDLWSMGNNWAFKNEIVKLNEEDKLNSIAKGCFYNFDALVINLHNFNFNIKYYKDFLNKNTLEILQKSPIYMNLNPTTEANILRAFFLKVEYNIEYSLNTKKYLNHKLGHLKDKFGNNTERLFEIKAKYPKYDRVLNEDKIVSMVNELIFDSSINNQFLLNI